MPNRLIDIHTHILPGVDDGADDHYMAIMMLIQSRDQYTNHIFLTPHSSAFDEDPEEVRKAFRKFQRDVAAHFYGMKLYLGCEIYCEKDRMPEVLENLRSGKYPTMNGTQYVLMEFFQWVRPETMAPCVKSLVDAGYIPIIAHVERYQYLQGNLELLRQLRALGARCQVNISSLFDEMDDTIKQWARQLVLAQAVDFLATDAHKTYYRPPNAKMGLKWLYENTERSYADAIGVENAEQLLCTAANKRRNGG